MKKRDGQIETHFGVEVVAKSVGIKMSCVGCEFYDEDHLRDEDIYENCAEITNCIEKRENNYPLHYIFEGVKNEKNV